MNAINAIRKQLFTLQDLPYRDFNAALIPTVDNDTIIGVRTPQLRAMAKNMAGSEDAALFMKDLPHKYFEENQLHAFLIEFIRDYDACIKELEQFLPHVDNWATCDQMCPKVFKKNLPRLSEQIQRWMQYDHPYTVRYAIGLRMRYYLDGAFSPEYPARIAAVDRKEYYIQMMQAWYFATALAKQPDTILPYFTTPRLAPAVRSMAIRKAIESRRINDEQKTFLRTISQ